MKILITFLTCFVFMCSAFAQGNYNTVTVNYNGQNRQVLIDGKSYTPIENPNYDRGAASGERSYNFSIVTNDLAPGAHKIQVSRVNSRRNTEATFYVRENYDLMLYVTGNGSLQQRETFRRIEGGGSGNVAMATADFNRLVSEIKRNRQATTRYNLIQSAFANTSHFFTTAQAKRLIMMISGEPFRLQLAKAAVRSITDTRSIYSLNTVLNSQVSRNELAEFIRTNGTAAAGTISTGNATTAMSNTSFTTLFEQVKDKWQSGARYSALQDAFSTSSIYFFSTGQVSQLIQLLSSERERLQMLKDAYKKTVDAQNYAQIYNLLSSDASREEIADYVRLNSTTQTPGSGGSPMSDASFNIIYNNIRSAWGTGVRKREILSVFANPNNYFTTYQAAQLVQLESAENDKLDLAKASLRSITDRQNIILLYNALSTQSARNELASYINSNGYNSTNPGTPVYTNTPMSDTDFATLVEDTRRLWIPGMKKASMLQLFAKQDTYFTTAQVLLLIQLDNDEDDRLELAKAAYRTVVDKNNFSRVYDIFTNERYKNELIAYVNANRY